MPCTVERYTTKVATPICARPSRRECYRLAVHRRTWGVIPPRISPRPVNRFIMAIQSDSSRQTTLLDAAPALLCVAVPFL